MNLEEIGQLGRIGHPGVHGCGNIDGQEAIQGDGLVMKWIVPRKGRGLLCTLYYALRLTQADISHFRCLCRALNNAGRENIYE